MPFLEFPGKLSIAVIPRLAYSKEVAELTHQHGKTVMLHQPMQPLGKADPGSGAIYVDMSDKDVRKTLNDNLDSIPHVVGFNNHMGSAATSGGKIEITFGKLNMIDEKKMMRLIKESGGDLKLSPQSVILVLTTNMVDLKEKSAFLRDKLMQLL